MSYYMQTKGRIPLSFLSRTLGEDQTNACLFVAAMIDWQKHNGDNKHRYNQAQPLTQSVELWGHLLAAVTCLTLNTFSALTLYCLH